MSFDQAPTIKGKISSTKHSSFSIQFGHFVNAWSINRLRISPLWNSVFFFPNISELYFESYNGVSTYKKITTEKKISFWCHLFTLKITPFPLHLINMLMEHITLPWPTVLKIFWFSLSMLIFHWQFIITTHALLLLLFCLLYALVLLHNSQLNSTQLNFSSTFFKQLKFISTHLISS